VLVGIWFGEVGGLFVVVLSSCDEYGVEGRDWFWVVMFEGSDGGGDGGGRQLFLVFGDFLFVVVGLCGESTSILLILLVVLVFLVLCRVSGVCRIA
jgi:hypothetical protein